MTVNDTGGGPAAGATVPNADVLDDLQASDVDVSAPAGYDRSDVPSADAAEPVDTPDMPVIPPPPADPSHPVGTAQEGSPDERPAVDIDRA
jgi:hypothetical protein